MRTLGQPTSAPGVDAALDWRRLMLFEIVEEVEAVVSAPDTKLRLHARA